MRRILLAFLILLPIHAFSASFEDEHLFVISGVVVNSGASKKIENFVEMIEKGSGYKLTPFYVNSYARLSETLEKYPDAIAWTCGAPYVEDAMRYQQQLVAVPLLNGLPTYRSFVIARKDDKRKKLSQFQNASFAYSDPRSNSGYLAPAILLKERGIDIEQFFRVKVLTGTHERSIESVYKGLADTAAVDEYIWVEYLRTRPYIADVLHVIETIGPFPFTPIVAGSGVKKDTLEKIQNVLVHMDPVVLKRFQDDFKMDGFVLKDPSFYDPIKLMLQTMKE